MDDSQLFSENRFVGGKRLRGQTDSGIRIIAVFPADMACLPLR
jgi:hypothetical protein